MVMKVYQSLWENDLNRTLIFSTLMILWTLLIELYFIFWPLFVIKQNIFLGWLYIDIFGYTPFLEFFHLVIWGLCFFFTWISYAMIKEATRSGQATMLEYIIMIIIFLIFIIILTNLTVGILFILLAAIEFLYMYFALQGNEI